MATIFLFFIAVGLAFYITFFIQTSRSRLCQTWICKYSETFTSSLSKKTKQTWKHIVLIKALQFDSVGWFLLKVSGKAKCLRKTLPTVPRCQLSHVCPLTDNLKALEFMVEKRFYMQETRDTAKSWWESLLVLVNANTTQEFE